MKAEPAMYEVSEFIKYRTEKGNLRFVDVKRPESYPSFFNIFRGLINIMGNILMQTCC